MNMGIQGKIVAAIMASALIGAGCKSGQHQGRHAMAELNPTAGNNVRGTVHFYETAKGVHVVASVSGLTPGKHGFHIHESGDCSAPDASSAKGHFNPAGMKHGGPHDAERHAGDFGNLVADASGNAKANFTDNHITFDGPTSIIGKGVIVHEKEDDLKSQQPTPGNAGKRVACGSIQIH
jgi:Cu-Zn family superoxide dismutase